MATVLLADATKASGVDFVHRVPAEPPYFMPRAVGSGAALFDYDGDGRLDMFLIQNGGPKSEARHQLYHQRDDGSFENVSPQSGLDIAGYGMGAAAGDVNNDGKVDLVLTEFGATRLFVNHSQEGRPRFVDVTASAGIDNPLWATSTALVDYDRDGWLDLLVVNYVEYSPARTCFGPNSLRDFCGPNDFSGRVARLYHNLGAQQGPPKFEEVTATSGLTQASGPGLGMFCADFDGDRWPDLLITNDGKPNHLWINQRNGKFKEEGALRGIAYNAMGKAEANMGIAIGDADGDGLFDIYVTHLTTEINRFWKQEPRGIFLDRTAAAGLAATAWRGTGFGTLMADFDNNGTLDLAIANGRVTRATTKPAPVDPQLDPFWVDYAERNQLLLNDGHGKFRDVSGENDPFCGTAAVARGLACGDLDNDGAVDLVCTYIAGPARIFRNTAPRRGHWLLVRAIDPALNRDAYGAEVYLTVGEQRLLRWINPGYSYLCSNDPRAHFGLGKSDKYDGLEVVWPDGTTEKFPGGAADRIVTIRKGEGSKE